MEPMCPFTLRTASGEVIPTDTDAPVTIALARATITATLWGHCAGAANRPRPRDDHRLRGRRGAALIAVPPEPLSLPPRRPVHGTAGCPGHRRCG